MSDFCPASRKSAFRTFGIAAPLKERRYRRTRFLETTNPCGCQRDVKLLREPPIRFQFAGRFGLSSSIQTTNLSRAFEYIYRAEAGLLTVNLPSAGVEYQLPFGGTKDSSFGPKEQGPAAFDFYSDYKTVYLKY